MKSERDDTILANMTVKFDWNQLQIQVELPKPKTLPLGAWVHHKKFPRTHSGVIRAVNYLARSPEEYPNAHKSDIFVIQLGVTKVKVVRLIAYEILAGCGGPYLPGETFSEVSSSLRPCGCPDPSDIWHQMPELQPQDKQWFYSANHPAEALRDFWDDYAQHGWREAIDNVKKAKAAAEALQNLGKAF